MNDLQWKILLNLMIWGYPYFRKPPFQVPKLAVPTMFFMEGLCNGMCPDFYGFGC